MSKLANRREPLFDFLRSICMLFLFMHHFYLTLPISKDYVAYLNPFAELFVGISGFMVGYVYLYKKNNLHLLKRGIKILLTYYVTAIIVETLLLVYFYGNSNIPSIYNRIIEIIFILKPAENWINILIFYAWIFILLPLILFAYKYYKKIVIFISGTLFILLLNKDLQNYILNLSDYTYMDYILMLFQWQAFFIFGLILGEKYKNNSLEIKKYWKSIVLIAGIALFIQVMWMHPAVLNKNPFTIEKILNLLYIVPLYLLLIVAPYNKLIRDSKFDQLIRVLGRNSLFAFAASEFIRICIFIGYHKVLYPKFNITLSSDSTILIISIIFSFILIYIILLYEKIKQNSGNIF
ncbi:OpgC domain-containing protein [Lysinibacillus pakistanensis]|uniref:Acyltransferase family protein n=1 Tax=Lysinibacillus pakistanensis TaxID=759811 RepID=A0ABX6D668_9BACI|nr:hypothetical protein GDS87_03135 [Lysinibacillus pakistanensis]